MEDAQQSVIAVAPPRRPDEADLWVPAPKLAEHFGIGRRTLARWLRDETLNFPKATVLKSPPLLQTA